MMGHLPHAAGQKQLTKISLFNPETFADKPQHLNGSGSAREQHATNSESTADGYTEGSGGGL